MEMTDPYDTSRARWKRRADYLLGAVRGFKLRVQQQAEELARLENDLADALDLKNGVGPTVLTALHTAKQEAESQLARVEQERDALDKDYGSLVAEHSRECGELQARLAALEAENGRLREALHSVREDCTGVTDFVTAKLAEAAQQGREK